MGRHLAGLWHLWLLRLALAHGPPPRTLHFERTRTPERRLQDRTWQPIRIHLETSDLQLADSSYLVREVLPAAVRWLSSAVLVLPVLGNLRLEQHCEAYSLTTKHCLRVASNYRDCGETQIPVAHFAPKEYCPSGKIGGCETSPGGDGLANTDLAIYVTAKNTQWCSGATVAYASACLQAEDDRPVAGYINFCPARLGHGGWLQDITVTIHEILHSMAFSSSLFAWFRDAEGRPRTGRDDVFNFPPLQDGLWVASSNTIREEMVDGQKRHFVVTPKVLQAAQRHFGCDSLTGIPLEEQGGDGTAFSHWDARVLHTEIMAAESSSVPRLSDLTLALLEDSGWYKVHGLVEDGDSVAGPFFFGKGHGCSFVEGKCILDERSAFPDTFCTEAQGRCSASWSGSLSCSHDHMAVGVCNNCVHAQALPVQYRHFSNVRLGGFARYVGYCPTVEPLRFCKEGSSYHPIDSQRIGESLGASSRCVLSTAIEKGFISPPEALGTCRNVYCDELGLRIQIGADFVQCLAAETGQQKQVQGRFQGYVVCPDYAKLCGAEGAHGPREGAGDCFFPGVHRHGRCVCPPGYLGVDCSVQDRSQHREDYPFGLRYPQQEFDLKVGVPLSQSSLASWPVRPSLLAGPSLLSFRVEPDLPAGLQLNEGVLEGEPMAPSPRKAYVIEASGWIASTTTVIFITVGCEGVSCSFTAPPTTTGSTTTGGQSSYDYAMRTGRLVLQLRRSFSELQEDPGLEVFAEELKALLRQLFGLQTQVAIAAGAQGRAVVEATVPLARQQPLAEELRQQLADPASELSGFGLATELRAATITSLGEMGSTQVWPPVQESEASPWLDVGEWQDWLTSQPLPVKVAIIAALSLTLTGLFLLCCRAKCCKRKSGERAHLAENMEMHYPPAPTTPTGWAAPTPLVIGRTPTVMPERVPDLDAAMEQMLGMGFPFEQSKACLEANGWDVAVASTAILERYDSQKSFEMDVQVESATDSEVPIHQVLQRPHST